jgi:hypothetical protein
MRKTEGAVNRVGSPCAIGEYVDGFLDKIPEQIPVELSPVDPDDPSGENAAS